MQNDEVVINLYHHYDPKKPADATRWFYCYLHGAAESAMMEQEQKHGWKEDSSDIFEADCEMPEDGCYLGNLYGKKCYIMIDKLEGRVGLSTDKEGLKHVLNPEQWR